MNSFEVKITGSGTIEQIKASLKVILDTVDGLRNMDSLTIEDPTLLAEFELIEED